jgi:hypothetical protein
MDAHNIALRYSDSDSHTFVDANKNIHANYDTHADTGGNEHSSYIASLKPNPQRLRG